MPAKVVLTVKQGTLCETEYVFEERTSCIIGRSADCYPRIPDDELHQTISRYHCLLDINPPDICIRDFGSLNGTYVNKKKIGQRASRQSAEEAATLELPEYDLHHGDEITLGKTILQVSVEMPLECNTCGAESLEEKGRIAYFPSDTYQCKACQSGIDGITHTRTGKTQTKKCLKCGRDVTQEKGATRQGDYICIACKDNAWDILPYLLKQTETEKSVFRSIQGYTIIMPLGEGGMGAVYLAREEQTKQQVALKVMLPRIAANEQAKAMFLREVENTKVLKHSNVVQFLESGYADGVFFFTLEFCSIGSVDKLMAKRGGRLSIAEAGGIILNTLDGLAYAHQVVIPNILLQDENVGQGCGLVHRDLSPQNILLSGTETAPVAKISDFGLAKAFDIAGLSGQSRTGSMAGKPFFMPRQQVINYKYAKPEVDVWAAAACFYYMLTGQYPRDFRRSHDAWLTVLQAPCVPIQKRVSCIPKALADVIDQALIDQPEIPFQNAAELKQKLEIVL